MGINFEWLDSGQMLCAWRFEGKWTDNDFRNVVQQTREEVLDLDHTFSLIIDLRNWSVRRFPMDEVRRALNVPVTKRDVVIIVTHDYILFSILGVLKRLGMPNTAAQNLTVVAKIPDAYKYIRDNLAGLHPAYLTALQSIEAQSMAR